MQETQETWVQSLGGGRYPGEENGQRNWRATVHGVAKSRTQLSMHMHAHMCINAPETDSNATSSSSPCHLPQGKQSPPRSRASLHQPSFTFESIIPTCGMKGGVPQGRQENGQRFMTFQTGMVSEELGTKHVLGLGWLNGSWQGQAPGFGLCPGFPLTPSYGSSLPRTLWKGHLLWEEGQSRHSLTTAPWKPDSKGLLDSLTALDTAPETASLLSP